MRKPGGGDDSNFEVDSSSKRYSAKKPSAPSVGPLHTRRNAMSLQTTFPPVSTTAWVGGSVVAQLGSFRDQMLLAEDYEEEGPDLVHKLNILSLES